MGIHVASVGKDLETDHTTKVKMTQQYIFFVSCILYNVSLNK